MTINRDEVKGKSREDFPYLFFLTSNGSKFKSNTLKVAAKTNAIVKVWNEENPNMIQELNKHIWDKTDPGKFILPVALSKNSMQYIHPNAFYKNEKIIHKNQLETITGKKQDDLYVFIFTIISQYKESSLMMAKWKKEKQQLIERDLELLQGLQTEKSKTFIRDMKRYQENNLHILFSSNRQEINNIIKTLHILEKYTNPVEGKDVFSCGHQNFSMKKENKIDVMTCQQCGLSFRRSGSGEWKTTLNQTQFSNYERNIDIFYHLEEKLNLESHPLIKFCIEIAMFLENANKYEFRATIKETERLRKDLKLLGVHTEPSNDFNQINYLLKWQIPSLGKKLNIKDWLKNVNLTKFESIGEETKIEMLMVLKQGIQSNKSKLETEKKTLEEKLAKAYQNVPSHIQLSPKREISTKECLLVLSLIEKFSGDFGLTTFANVLKGSKSKKMYEFKLHKEGQYGALHHYKIADIQEIIAAMIQNGFLLKVGWDYPKVKVTEKGIKNLILFRNGSKSKEEQEEEKNKFLHQTWDEFVVTLANPVVVGELKEAYLHKNLQDDNGKVYQKVLEEALDKRELIPILEPFLKEYYQTEFFPVFSLYRKTRKGKFGDMIERILLKQGNEGEVC